MPLFNLRCPDCGLARKAIAESWAEVQKTCTWCGAEARRDASGPSARVIEKLDNGAMARAVERPRDAEEWRLERSLNADPNAGGGARSGARGSD